MQDENESSPIPDTGTLNYQFDPVTCPLFELTQREKEVLKLLVDGLPYNQIASQLKISRRTVGNHVASIYRKLGVTNRAQVLRYVLEHPLF